ncbi:MAG TPA: MBL fold metallo-hydrolase [Myxococcota bacterium]|nr:MBL fold metallo-hydrolase [Myxococcota bacterium]
MRIRFVNHASVIFEHGATRLVTDPWLYGTAFNEGWDLVCKSAIGAAELGAMTHVWYSHEHPDHFSPRVLQDVPAERRGAVTVLYRKTRDGKVIGFCKKLGFKTRELADGEAVELGPEFRVTSQSVPLFDSWLLVEAGGKRALDLNDAVVQTPAELRRLAESLGALDVLLTQFSYAAWRGNREDVELRRADARRKLDVVRAQVRGLRPRFTIPFASMSFFSHVENSFTSDSINHPWEVLDAIAEQGSTPVLLYPGDEWEIGAPHSNDSATERYRRDYAELGARELHRGVSVPFEKLVEAADVYRARIRAANSGWLLEALRWNPVLPTLRPLDVHLWDLERDVRFSFERGLEPIPKRDPGYDLAMGSDSLAFVFRQAWGIDTLTVNGRFRADPEGMKRLVLSFGVDMLNNTGIALGPAFLFDFASIGFLLRILFRKLESLRSARPAAAGERAP